MKNVYFIGIGGIGMSALARYYKFKGYNVAGYDRTPSDLTFALEAEGIDVHYQDQPELLPEDKNETLVVYTPAIPADLGELVKAREEGYLLLKRSRTLGEVAKGQRCLAVAGTHGKTTTSTLIAHILTHSGAGCSAFLGGISRNYGTNLLVSENPTIVAEADEFDRSFLQLFPEIAVITAVDADHLDIYGDYAHVVEAFKAFASQVSGILIAKKGIPVGPADTKAKVYTYHYTDTSADFYPVSAQPDACGCFHYDLHTPDGVIPGFKVGAPGWVNCENSVAAAALIPIRFDQFSENNECRLVEAQNDNMVRFYDSFNSFGHVGNSALNTVVDQTDQHSEEENADQGGQKHKEQEDPASRITRQYARVKGVVHSIPQGLAQRILTAEHHRQQGDDKDENSRHRKQQDDSRQCSF